MAEVILPPFQERPTKILLIEDKVDTNDIVAFAFRRQLPNITLLQAYAIKPAEKISNDHSDIDIFFIDAELPYDEGSEVLGVERTCDFCLSLNQSHPNATRVAWSEKGMNIILCPRFCHCSIDFKDQRRLPALIDFARNIIDTRRRKMPSGFSLPPPSNPAN